MVMLLGNGNRGRGREGEGGGYDALHIVNVNIDKYEQRQCNQLAGTIPIQCGSVGRIFPFTSLHTTGSLCVPVDNRTDTRSEFPKIYEQQANIQSYGIKSLFFCFFRLYRASPRSDYLISHILCRIFLFHGRQVMDGTVTWASSSSVKSFLMLKVFLISSGVLPLIMLATVLQVTSNRPLISK